MNPRRTAAPRVLACALACTAGCVREFALPPPAEKLAIEPASATVAPREKLQLSVKGGTPPYSFVFAEGGRLSGENATVFAATGLYQAGRRGLADDVIEAFDAAGRSAKARITVGAPLAVTPQIVSAAPGDFVEINISGGKPPYAVTVFENGSGGTLSTDPPPTSWTAGPVGPEDDILVVHDATGDADYYVLMLVEVGPRVSIFAPGGAGVAPFGTVDFIALGGKPPYTFELTEGPSGGSIDPDTGRYRAGPVGGVTDVVRVRDYNLEEAFHDVKVGPALALRLDNPDLRPGAPTLLVASGGEPPYSFRFLVDADGVPRGNRSGGAIDAVTGEYTPGFNAGAEDLLEVIDATPLGIARLEPPVPVGQPRIPIGHAPRVLTADLNADGRDDVVLATLLGWACRNCLGHTRLAAVIPRPAAAPEVAEYFFPFDDPLLDAVTADADGDGRADVVAHTQRGLSFFRAELDGRLVALPRAFTSSLAVHSRMLHASRAPNRDFHVFVGEGRSSICDDTENHAGIVRVVWPLDAPGPNAPECVLKIDQASSVLSAAAKDFDGDGELELAWIDAADAAVVHLERGPGFDVADRVDVDLPAGSGALSSYYSDGTMSAAELDPATPGALFVATTDGAASAIVVIDTQSGALVGTPFVPAGKPILGMRPYVNPATEAAEFLYTWNGYDGQVNRLAWTAAAGFVALAEPPARAFGIDGLAFGDVNGDGVADFLATGGSFGATDVALGDGDGGFARRRHVTELAASAAIAAADVDGDGIEDLVSATDDPALVVRFGGGHQLAVAPVVRVPGPPFGIAAADFTGDGFADVLYQKNAGGLWLFDGDGRGGFAAPRDVVESGGSTAFLFSFRPAEFGGAAPGPDLAGLERFTFVGDEEQFTLVALVRDGETSFTRVAAPPLLGLNCRFISLPLDADGVDDVVVSCVRNVSGVFHALLYRSFAQGTGATFAFGAWQTAFDKPCSPSPSTGAVPVGLVGSTAIFGVRSSGEPVRLVLVGPAGSLREMVLPAYARGGTGAHLDGDAFDDFAVALSDGTVRTYLGGSDGNFVLHSTLKSPSSIFGALRLAATPAPADLLLRAGDDIVIFQNDGTGQFP